MPLWSRIHPGHCLILSHRVSLDISWLWSFSDGLFLVTLTVLARAAGQVNCPSVGIFWYCSHVSTGSLCSRKEDPSGSTSFSSHPVKGTCCHHPFSLLTLTLIPWSRRCSSGLSSVFLPLFSQKEITMYSPHQRGEEAGSNCSTVGYLHKYLEFSAQEICLFYSCLFNNLFPSVWIHKFLLSNSSYNVICCTNCFSFSFGSSFNWSLCPFGRPPSLCSKKNKKQKQKKMHFLIFWNYKMNSGLIL